MATTSKQNLDQLKDYLQNNPKKVFELAGMIELLVGDNPNSELAKQWKTALGNLDLEDVINSASMSDTDSKDTGYSNWEKYFNQMYGKWHTDEDGNQVLDKAPMRTGFTVNRIVLPSIGKGLQGVGAGINAYNSILGGALAAMAANQPKYNYDRTGMSNMIQNALAIEGAKKIALGQVANIAGNTTGNIINDAAAALEEREEKARTAALMSNENPTGKYWDQVGRMEKRADKIRGE